MTEKLMTDPKDEAAEIAGDAEHVARTWLLLAQRLDDADKRERKVESLKRLILGVRAEGIREGMERAAKMADREGDRLVFGECMHVLAAAIRAAMEKL